MIAEIISIGDELLIGQVVNTNATWMGQRLNEIGVDVKTVTCIGDEKQAILEAIRIAFERSQAVLITGGLGPTKDDITKQVLSDFFDSELVLNTEILKTNNAYFKVKGFAMTEVNKLQAYIPAACEAIVNSCGSAAGMWFEKAGKILISMPGVPYEMKTMMQLNILPRLHDIEKDNVIIHQTIMTHGIGESFLSDMIEDWELHLPKNLKLAYLPTPGILRLRITAKGSNYAELQKIVADETEKLISLIPQYVFALEDISMQEVVIQTLKKMGISLALAESCTGGYISHLLTSIPGSSEVYKGGVVAYSNESKVNLLGVDATVIEENGAASEEVVKQMARGAQIKFDSDYAISISGIAGPSGGTKEKPIGTIWIAVANKYEVVAQCFNHHDSRDRTIIRSTMSAMNMLLKNLCSFEKIKGS